ncbi:cell wall elongation regulator TseB-like domain-containing protein [Lacticaseibacillus sharpeae]|uniref:Cell wall elongation regulator TseB-like domain-containing protein n=1 Tax=Lacticaseibacillus sharpeae JCM 1186 = DSM 20505 TaxID=1291052 RepID=A0A0R1ZM22_9LACO|nr:hypothetical protein [Lacticaseibacillus sharpeae]KRM56045.1 hypothetical protein FC18_GL000831 [Lacticaseibacillus sharpeae JCM 1186 = DSM 20505]
MRSKTISWQRWAISGVILVVIFAIGFVLWSAMHPYSKVRSEAENIARTSAKTTNINGFWWDTRDKSYLTVSGERGGAPVYVVIAKKTGKVNVLHKNNGTTRNKILRKVWADFTPKRVLNASLRKTGKDFVWDVGFMGKNGTLGYVTYDFATGQQLKVIRDL